MSELPTTIHCKGCGAEIVFLTTELGAKMPCDAKPLKVLVPVQPHAYPMIYQVENGYVSHFSTCPKADEFRKGRAG